jgi:hypothetical protein
MQAATRRAGRRPWRGPGLALAAAAGLAGCLVSDTPVEPGQHASGEVEVFGYLYHVHGSVRSPAGNNWVRVTWYRETGSGALAQLGQPDVQGTLRDGVYRVKNQDPAVRAARVQGVTCRYDPDHPDPATQCCLQDRPTCTDCERVWVSGREIRTRAGEGVRLDVDVYCPQ